MAKENIHSYTAHTYGWRMTNKELQHMQKWHPVLLGQIYEYGYENDNGEHHFYGLPKNAADAVQDALKDSTWRAL